MQAMRNRWAAASWRGASTGGPGYRIYFSRQGARVVILLAGGTKRRQAADIADAKASWSEYRERRKTERE